MILNTANSDFTDPAGFGQDRISDTAVFWTANGSADARVELFFGFNNYVIAAPTEDPALNRIDAIYRGTFFVGNTGQSFDGTVTAGL